MAYLFGCQNRYSLSSRIARASARACCRRDAGICTLEAAATAMRTRLSRVTTQRFLTRGFPIRAGWNSTAAAIVQTSAKAISFPILDVAGSLDNHRLPNALAVAMALKMTARVKVDCTSA